MIIAGCNQAHTSYGKSLPDGGMAVIRDGKLIYAIAEDRISRNKGEGGFSNAIEHYSRFLKGNVFDEIVISSCCEYSNILEFRNLPSKKVTRCSHHRSHALGAFAWSGFDKAIILVMDSGGDVINEFTNSEWWKSEREQHSIFLIDGDEITLLARHAHEPEAIGFGELFRSMTYLLGWHGARYAGNTMAAAALAPVRSHLSNIRLFEENGNKFKFPTGNDPRKNGALIQELLLKYGISNIIQRTQESSFSPKHFELAAWLQSELDRYIARIVDIYCASYKTNNFIISGGVAYNCVSAGRLQNRNPDLNVFVHPASGDVGQCLGNAIDGYLRNTGRILRLANHRVDLGGKYRMSPKRRKRMESISSEVHEDPSFVRLFDVLSAGKICALYHGRSEFGPRALGFRSILADATYPALRARLNEIKSRNYIMPVAPVVRTEDANIYFDMKGASPYMTKTAPIRSEYMNILRSCGQGEGWARVQTVSSDENEVLYKLLTYFSNAGRTPVLLNTSLNGPGEPIVESIDNLIDWCNRSNIDYVWVSGHIYKLNSVISEPFPFSRSKYSEIIDKDYNAKYLKRRLETIFPHVKVRKRERLLLRIEYINWVKSGRKTTTVRFRPDSIEFPVEQTLPLFASNRFEGYIEGETSLIGQVFFTKATYKRFSELDEVDAIADGFRSEAELKNTLKEIYPNLSDESMVSIFDIRIE